MAAKKVTSKKKNPTNKAKDVKDSKQMKKDSYKTSVGMMKSKDSKNC